VKKGRDGFYCRYVKRLLDIILSATALVILGIPMLIVSLLVCIDMGRPVIFTQKRVGKNEKTFRLRKFRSMRNGFDPYGVPLPDSERLTKLGRILRKTSVDELPSLLNIIQGDMSIVGPRPLPLNYKPWYKAEERIRHSVRGGLTGLAQINGRNAISWEEKFSYDKDYVENISFAVDVKIVAQTVLKVIRRADIGERQSNTSPCDFHSYRSGLSERELLRMENRGTLPDTYEQWWAMTEDERKARYFTGEDSADKTMNAT